jgi:hypothetical protein
VRAECLCRLRRSLVLPRLTAQFNSRQVLPVFLERGQERGGTGRVSQVYDLAAQMRPRIRIRERGLSTNLATPLFGLRPTIDDPASGRHAK